MKQHNPQKTAKQRLFISLLFSWIALTGFSGKIHAQGWSFTFSLYQSGPCGTNAVSYANSLLGAIPNLGLPTQAICQSLRQQVLAIQESVPEYDNNGNFIGNCVVGYNCTPCTGSNIVTTSSSLTPGTVTLNSASQGQAFFTASPSSAFEDWAKDYRQQLAEYGMTSILGNSLISGDPSFDAAYNQYCNGFNPQLTGWDLGNPTNPFNPFPNSNDQGNDNTPPPPPPPPSPPPPAPTPNQDASVVDLSDKTSGTPQLLDNAASQAAAANWVQQNTSNLSQATTDGGMSENAPPEDPTLEQGHALMDAIAQFPGGALPAAIGNGIINLADNTMQGISNAVNGNLTPEQINNLPQSTLVNSVGQTVQQSVTGAVSDFTTEGVGSLASGAVGLGESGGKVANTIVTWGQIGWGLLPH